jgi:hypothetical protein
MASMEAGADIITYGKLDRFGCKKTNTTYWNDK